MSHHIRHQYLHGRDVNTIWCTELMLPPTNAACALARLGEQVSDEMQKIGTDHTSFLYTPMVNTKHTNAPTTPRSKPEGAASAYLFGGTMIKFTTANPSEAFYTHRFSIITYLSNCVCGKIMGDWSCHLWKDLKQQRKHMPTPDWWCLGRWWATVRKEKHESASLLVLGVQHDNLFFQLHMR